MSIVYYTMDGDDLLIPTMAGRAKAKDGRVVRSGQIVTAKPQRKLITERTFNQVIPLPFRHTAQAVFTDFFCHI